MLGMMRWRLNLVVQINVTELWIACWENAPKMPNKGAQSKGETCLLFRNQRMSTDQGPYYITWHYIAPRYDCFWMLVLVITSAKNERKNRANVHADNFDEPLIEAACLLELFIFHSLNTCNLVKGRCKLMHLAFEARAPWNYYGAS